MKFLSLIFLIYLTGAFAAVQNPGFKMRITKLTLKELMETSEKIMTKDFKAAKKLFKTKFEQMEWPPATGIFSKDAKITDVDLISYKKGQGSKMEFAAPNIMKSTCKGADFKFALTVKDMGKTGKVTFDVVNMNSESGLAFSNKGGKLQMALTTCQMSVGKVTVTVKGFGAKADAEHTKKAQALVDTMAPKIGPHACKHGESMIAMFNKVIMKKDCNMAMPFIGDDLLYSFCLTDNPKATTDYIEFSFCGATMKKGVKTPPKDYTPGPLAMSDDGVSKMLYFWEGEAMHNYFWKQMFEAKKLTYKFNKKSKPKLAEKMKKKLMVTLKEAFGINITKKAEIDSTVQAVEAPVVTFTKAKPTEMGIKGKISITHKIKDQGKDITVNAVIAIQGGIGFKIGMPKKGEMFPKFIATVGIDKVTIEKTTPNMKPGMKAKYEAKIKTGMPKRLNKGLKKFINKWEKWVDKATKPYKGVIQVTKFDLKMLDKTAESSGNVKFDIVKLSELTKMKGKKPTKP
jgi:hypothetical protein